MKYLVTLIHKFEQFLRVLSKDTFTAATYTMFLISKGIMVLVCWVYSTHGLYPQPAPEMQGKEGPLPEITVLSENYDYEKSFEVPLIEIQVDRTGQNAKTTSERQQYPYPLKFVTNLIYFNRTLHVSMIMNTFLMSYKPKLISFAENGTLLEQEDPDNCAYYQGYEASLPNSSSTMCLCEDGLEGVIMVSGKRLLLEPSSRYSPMNQRGQKFVFGPHRLRESNAKMNENFTLDFVLNTFTESAKGRMKRQNPEHLTRTKYVEMYFVNDKSEFTWLGSDTKNNMRRMKQVANIMDSLYHPYNIRALLMGVEVWNDKDKMVVGPSASNTLQRFLEYKNTNIIQRFHHDCSLFVTHFDFTGPTIGLAPISGMCHPRYSGNINQDTSVDFTLVAGTMIHEMGHNFGMKHDATGCPCSDRNGRCIMAPTAQNPIPTTFSSCSTNDLNAYLRGDMARCLMAAPNLEIGLYIRNRGCGNNRMDDGEECDCGLPRWCKNPCCDPNTCRLKSGYQCAYGGCCSHCRLTVKGAICRRAYGKCDIEERCDGVSSLCPADLYVRDGTGCSAHGQDGYCRKGRCWSHNSQCQYGWGGRTRQADLRCYNFNIRGDKYGNCGISGVNYVKCTHQDRYCGQLHCIGRPSTSRFPIIGFSRGRLSFSFFSYGIRVQCDMGIASLGRGEPNPCKYFPNKIEEINTLMGWQQLYVLPLLVI